MIVTSSSGCLSQGEAEIRCELGLHGVAARDGRRRHGTVHNLLSRRAELPLESGRGALFLLHVEESSVGYESTGGGGVGKSAEDQGQRRSVRRVEHWR